MVYEYRQFGQFRAVTEAKFNKIGEDLNYIKSTVCFCEDYIRLEVS